MEVDALFFHPAANCLEHRESAVAFVQVQDARRNPHGLQGAKASDAQQQFLADTNPAIATIQAATSVRDLPEHFLPHSNPGAVNRNAPL